MVSDSDDEIHERGRVNSMKEHIKEFPISFNNMASWRKFSLISKDSPYEAETAKQFQHPTID